VKTSARALLFALVLGVLGALTACGGTPAAYAAPGPVLYCAGPGVDNVFDRDKIRWPDEGCASGSLAPGFALVSAASWAEVPDIGEEVDFDNDWGFHRTHRVGHSTRVIYVQNPPTRPVVYLLQTREPTVGSVVVRQKASTAAQKARKTTPPAAVTSVKDDNQRPLTGSSTAVRGGLGVKPTGNVDRADVSQQKARAASAKAADLGRQKASTSTAVSKPSGGTSSVRSSTSTKTK
jgi:hypothetical protein